MHRAHPAHAAAPPCTFRVLSSLAPTPTRYTNSLLNRKQRHAAIHHQTNQLSLGLYLGREFVCKLLSYTPTVTVQYYSTRKLIVILASRGGQKAESILEEQHAAVRAAVAQGSHGNRHSGIRTVARHRTAILQRYRRLTHRRPDSCFQPALSLIIHRTIETVSWYY